MRISDWSSDVCSSDLADIPHRPQLPVPGPRTRRRNPRKLARSQPLPQNGRTARAEENRTTQSRITNTMTANLQSLTHTTAITKQSCISTRLDWSRNFQLSRQGVWQGNFGAMLAWALIL